MNERIEQLAIQATEIKEYKEYGAAISVLNAEKFAELIVRECCELLKGSGDAWEKFSRNPPEGQEVNAGPALFAAYRLKEDAVDMLEEHFGIGQ